MNVMPQFPAWCFPRQTGRILTLQPSSHTLRGCPAVLGDKENRLPGSGTNEQLPAYNQGTRSPGDTTSGKEDSQIRWDSDRLHDRRVPFVRAAL